MNNLSKNNIKRLIAAFYISALFIQSLVILKLIPYDWVNGGMSESYEAQLAQSLISIVIISLLFVFVWRLANQKDNLKKWKLRALYIITIFWLLGLFMQIAGTEFERYVLSLSLLLGVLSHVLLIKNIRNHNF